MIASRWLVAALVVEGGCTVSRTRGHTEVAQLVNERIGQKTHWDQGSPEDAEVAKVVNALLRNRLTRETAVEIALVNNRRLQETYEELGISQADMVQAGLLKNPSLSFAVGFPIGVGINEFTGSLVQDFLDLLVLPMRKKRSPRSGSRR
jgi:cobalt-zinc-cadmium efflux system outer membrane protein